MLCVWGGGRGCARPCTTRVQAVLIVPPHLSSVAACLVQLAEMHTKLDHLPEATKLVTDAMHEFAGTPEEVRVVVANSEIAMKRGDTEAAIHMLGNIPPDSSSYTKAQMVKADILLKVRCCARCDPRRCARRF